MRNRSHNYAVPIVFHGNAVEALSADYDWEPELVGSKIKPQPNGCWLFNGKIDKYGKARVKRRTVLVHRWVYEVLVGPIPEGHYLHHLCVTPGCCNPEHLEPVTAAQHRHRHVLISAEQQ